MFAMRPDAIPVEMTKYEVMWAAHLGAIRRASGWWNDLNDKKHTDKKSDWATDIDGVLAEMATAKWLGVYYAPSNMDFKGPDVGRRCQTRSTCYEDGKLFIRPNDKPLKDQPFVLCITCKKIVWLCGWQYGEKCMLDKHWVSDAWRVTQDELIGMDRFPVPRQKSLFAA